MRADAYLSSRDLLAGSGSGAAGRVGRWGGEPWLGVSGWGSVFSGWCEISRGMSSVPFYCHAIGGGRLFIALAVGDNLQVSLVASG
jgi:hypothetical protein